MPFFSKFVFFIVFIRLSPDIRWKCYKNTENSRTKKNEIYENRMFSVIKIIQIELLFFGINYLFI